MRPSLRVRRTGVRVLLSASAGCATGSTPAYTGPQVLGPESISVGNVYRGTFTPDGDTLYFFKNVTEGEEDYRIFRAHRDGSSWSKPEPISLGGDYSDLYPAISPDGRRMVFSSYRPAPGDTSTHPSAYLWYVEREGPRWGPPVFMAEASEWAHYHAQPIFNARGDLYFNRSGWDYRGHSEHVSRWDGRQYVAPDTSAGWLTWRDRIEPGRHLYETTPGYDGSFLLLVIGERPDSGRPGPPDLYVTFRSDTGWTAPRPLGAGVNTPGTENFAFYGAGGRELYFVRDFSEFYHLPVVRALYAPSFGENRRLRVLFVGNSFTVGNDLPRLVAESGLSHDPPVRLEVESAARDGMTLERHWKEGDVARRLREEAWDVVVLQEQSARPLTDPKLMETYVRRFAALAKEAGTEVILFQTWARLDEPETEQPRAAVYRRIAEAVGATVAPVGAAWSRALARRSEPRLHAADGLHASPAGSRLAASEILQAVLRLDRRPAR